MNTPTPTPNEQIVIMKPNVQALINALQLDYIPSPQALTNTYLHKAASELVHKSTRNPQ